MLSDVPWVRRFVAVFALVTLASALHADAVMRIENDEIVAGTISAEFPIVLDTDTEVYGFQLSLSTDSALIEMQTIDLKDGAARDADFSQGFVIDDGGSLSWGVVLDVTDPIDESLFIPAGNGLEIAWLVADIVSTEAAETQIRFLDRAAQDEVPGARNKVVRDFGLEIPLETVDGTIMILAQPSIVFIRGNANQDSGFDLSDGVFTLNYLFTGGPEPLCLDAADTSDDGVVDLSDAVLSFNNLFLGGAPPLPPHPGYGVDPTEDALGCENSQLP
jgi:hypothetical protein